MKIIVGLGNPGRTYAKQRHNVGFMVLDLLAEQCGIALTKHSFGALVGSGAIEGNAVLLVKPETFMNLSGEAVAALVGFYKLEPKDLIVLHDEMDIELGYLKIMRGRGPGGHNGVSSIIASLATQDFVRIRVGIGRPPAGADPTGYVLSPFEKSEREAAENAVRKAADALHDLLRDGLSAAQQRYH